MQIHITHRGTQHRKYRVIGLTKDGANTQTFPFQRDGNIIDMTVKDYFEREFNLTLRYDSC